MPKFAELVRIDPKLKEANNALVAEKIAEKTAEPTSKRDVMWHVRNNGRKRGETLKLILADIDAHPGATAAPIAKRLGFAETGSLHLTQRVKAGHIRVKFQDGKNRYYPKNYQFAGEPAPEAPQPTTIRERAYAYITDHPGTTRKEISEATGLSMNSLSHIASWSALESRKISGAIRWYRTDRVEPRPVKAPEPTPAPEPTAEPTNPRDWLTEQRLKRAQARAEIERAVESPQLVRETESEPNIRLHTDSLERAAQAFIWAHPDYDLKTLIAFVSWRTENSL